MRAALVMLAVVCAGARAQTTLYAVDGSRDVLLTVDLTTGATRDVGPLGFNGSFWGLAFNPVPVPAPGGGVCAPGTLFGVDRGSQALYTLNMNTGAATLVGPLQLLGLWEALTFDTQGQLWTTDVYDRFRIDTATGQAVHVVGGFNVPGGIAHSLDTLSAAIPAAGAGVLPAGTIVGCRAGAFFALDGTTWDPLFTAVIPQAQEVVVAAPDGGLFAVGGPPGDLWLWRISLDPIAAHPIGPLGSGSIWGGAIIPAPGTVLVLLGAGLALNRRRSAPGPRVEATADSVPTGPCPPARRRIPCVRTTAAQVRIHRGQRR